jgi:carboxymethylenebutenolidase
VDKKRKMGTTGYCMGGPFVFRTASAFPARVGAGATFHGGGLATDKPESPHLLIPQMKAQFLIAIAENDDQREPDVKNILRDSFAKAHLTAEIEVYAGTKHGWCPPDSAVYNAEQAEKAWGRMMVLFKTALA